VPKSKKAQKKLQADDQGDKCIFVGTEMANDQTKPEKTTDEDDRESESSGSDHLEQGIAEATLKAIHAPVLRARPGVENNGFSPFASAQSAPY
jgi:hypothetical protein